MSKRIIYFFSMIHESMDFSPRDYDVPRYVREEKTPMEVLLEDWHMICHDGKISQQKVKGFANE